MGKKKETTVVNITNLPPEPEESTDGIEPPEDPPSVAVDTLPDPEENPLNEESEQIIQDFMEDNGTPPETGFTLTQDALNNLLLQNTYTAFAEASTEAYKTAQSLVLKFIGNAAGETDDPFTSQRTAILATLYSELEQIKRDTASTYNVKKVELEEEFKDKYGTQEPAE